ncbi:lantibiotic dehydratase [Nostoc sp. FACHB-152]|uniref:lantibiotic dehydratase n=1 Tax=unclassified Nostoc TaxID=2593658 RepID=UPI0016839838|nr:MULTISPECIES: lantibiotic dehydratase [unclassified Nostoc]MBD2451007.1 lantibiotic dehydratase [Nostoc sp. FACHB-152]MBD2472075.1 lantibiotic dehydratase [Nostoc sp. FACHB-145]
MSRGWPIIAAWLQLVMRDRVETQLTMNNRQRFEFAPAGILRAAAWPIEAIQGFGNPELANLALAAIRSQDAHTWTEYTTAYQQVHEQERERLWLLTAGDSWFMKALLLSNPSLVTEVQRGLPLRQEKRTKKIRKLETALYRYLARAAGRTTPYGLWAGVSLVQLGKTAQQASAKAQYSFTPDLRPWQTILRSLAQRPKYRQAATWRLNPTLKRQADGSWRFWGRTPNGLVEQREIDSQEIVDVLLEKLTKLELGTLDQLCRTLAASPRWNYAVKIRDILEMFIDGGVLLGGLDLPSRFENPWQALEVVADKLIEPDRHFWNTAIQQLHYLSDTLATQLEVISLDAVAEYLQQAKAYIQELAQGLGVELQLPDLVLHCDLGLPLRITLDEVQQDSLRQTLLDYEECWIGGVSPASALRMAFRERLQQEFALGVALSDLKPNLTVEMRKAVSCSVVTTRIAEWQHCLSHNTEEVVLDISNTLNTSLLTAPFGCLFVGLFAGGRGQRAEGRRQDEFFLTPPHTPTPFFQQVVHGIGDEPVRIFARFSQLLKCENILHSWFQERLEDLATQHQIQLAELQTPFERNPNVLARPNFGLLPIELWGASADTPSLADAKIFLDGKTQLPFLKLSSCANPVAVFWFSLAAIATFDPICEQLLWTTFQDNPMAVFRAATQPMQIELTTPRFTPRVRLPQDAILRPRRTVLSGEILAELAQIPAMERFAKWQQLAAEYNWPMLLNLQIAGQYSLLVNRDSPLALESFFKKNLQAQTPWLIVEELVNQPWLVDSQGQHYMAELALPFARTEHGWSNNFGF